MFLSIIALAGCLRLRSRGRPTAARKTTSSFLRGVAARDRRLQDPTGPALASGIDSRSREFSDLTARAGSTMPPSGRDGPPRLLLVPVDGTDVGSPAMIAPHSAHKVIEETVPGPGQADRVSIQIGQQEFRPVAGVSEPSAVGVDDRASTAVGQAVVGAIVIGICDEQLILVSPCRDYGLADAGDSLLPSAVGAGPFLWLHHPDLRNRMYRCTFALELEARRRIDTV